VGRPPVEGVHSTVYVMRKEGIATRNVAAARNVSVPRCVQRLSMREAQGRFIGRESYKRHVEVSSLPFPLAGIPGYGLRVRSTLASALFHQKKRSPSYEDTFGFAIGPAEIVLKADGVGHPFPSAEERRLLSVIYNRAKTSALL